MQHLETLKLYDFQGGLRADVLPQTLHRFKKEGGELVDDFRKEDLSRTEQVSLQSFFRIVVNHEFTILTKLVDEIRAENEQAAMRRATKTKFAAPMTKLAVTRMPFREKLGFFQKRLIRRYSICCEPVQVFDLRPKGTYWENVELAVPYFLRCPELAGICDTLLAEDRIAATKSFTPVSWLYAKLKTMRLRYDSEHTSRFYEESAHYQKQLKKQQKAAAAAQAAAPSPK